MRPPSAAKSTGLRFRPPSFHYVHPIRHCSRAVYYEMEKATRRTLTVLLNIASV
jgi:hypothetical protein